MFESGEIYEDGVFKSLDCKGKSFEKKEFTHIIFESCDFTHSNWRQAKFNNCTFKSCNLSLINLEGCRLKEVFFEGSKLVGLDFFKCEKTFFSIAVRGSILQTCNFAELNLKKSVFKESKIRESHFANTDLTSADFTETDLLGTVFHRCVLSKADFRNAKNYLINPTTNNIKKARFSFPEALNLLKCFDIEVTI